MGQDTNGINLMEQSHLGCSRPSRNTEKRERDHPASSMNFEGEYNYRESGTKKNIAAYESIRFLEHVRQCISHAYVFA